MVRRRSTVRFRKGAPQFKPIFRNYPLFDYAAFVTFTQPSWGPSDSEGGLGVGSVGGGSGEPAVPWQQFGSPDLGGRLARLATLRNHRSESQAARERPERRLGATYGWVGGACGRTQIIQLRVSWVRRPNGVIVQAGDCAAGHLAGCCFAGTRDYSALSTIAGWVCAAARAGKAAIALASTRVAGKANSTSGEMTGTGSIANWVAKSVQAQRQAEDQAGAGDGGRLPGDGRPHLPCHESDCLEDGELARRRRRTDAMRV